MSEQDYLDVIDKEIDRAEWMIGDNEYSKGFINGLKYARRILAQEIITKDRNPFEPHP